MTSARILEAVDALPLRPSVRVLEIGCGPGVAARAIVERVPGAFVLGIDRSTRAIGIAERSCANEIAAGSIALRVSPVEAFELAPGEPRFDLAFALRVGVLDGRHPALEAVALERIASALAPGGRLFVDGGDPLREIALADHR